MKKEQSLQHLIVTEMPYELLKLLIEEKALNFFIRNLIVDTENNAIRYKCFNKKRHIIHLMEYTPANIILRAFTWDHSVISSKRYEFWSKIYRKAILI